MAPVVHVWVGRQCLGCRLARQRTGRVVGNGNSQVVSVVVNNVACPGNNPRQRPIPETVRQR